MRFRGVLLAGTVLAAPVAASAQPFEGIYIGAGAGYNYLQEIDVRPSPGLYTPAQKIQGNSGWAGLGSIGYGFGNGLRLEAEGNYRDTQNRKITGTAYPTEAGGQIQTYGAMVNALFDLDIGFPWLYPYLGVGAGYGWTDLNKVYASGPSVPALLNAGSNRQGNFAWQVIAGLSFPVPDVPGLSLTAEYRFYSIVGPTGIKDSSATYGAPLRYGTGNLTLRNQYNNSALLGVRYAFNVAPPAPPAAPAPVEAPAPAAARSYLVFFDWDKATLTDRARQIVAEAARNSTTVQYTRIEVNGYTDTSGSARYNQGLSVRRAQAVAAELVKDGVPRQAITIQGFGETHLLVPTGPNVREPQNRRVEIILK
ncbi:MAG: OmpA family protein [Acetobacteraceae bacterium]|nr:OmpA family protein [Acetobacteraceae bacterium]